LGTEGVVQPENSVPQLMGCYPGHPLGAYVVQKDKPTLPIDGHVALTGVGGGFSTLSICQMLSV